MYQKSNLLVYIYLLSVGSFFPNNFGVLYKAENGHALSHMNNNF